MAERTRIETVNTNGFTMDFFRFGCGGEALAILPGLSVQSVMNLADAVADAYRLLADDFTVYVFDRRRELPDAYPIYDMARDTAAAMKALDLHHVNLMGASQGGMIAMAIAVEHPELVRKLVLCSTAARVAGTRAIDRWIGLAKAGRAEELYLAFGEDVYPRDVFDQSRDALIAAAATVTDDELARFVILAEDIRGFDIADDLAKIACPALMVGSRDDRVLGGDASMQIAERLRNCELHMYDGYGHAAYDTAPDFKARVLRFLKP